MLIRNRNQAYSMNLFLEFQASIPTKKLTDNLIEHGSKVSRCRLFKLVFCGSALFIPCGKEGTNDTKESTFNTKKRQKIYCKYPGIRI